MRNGKRRIVFKVGTSTLAHHTGRTNIRHMEELVRFSPIFIILGCRLCLSPAQGWGQRNWACRQSRSILRQAGGGKRGQCELMFLYDKMFSDYGQIVAQMLITKRI